MPPTLLSDTIALKGKIMNEAFLELTELQRKTQMAPMQFTKHPKYRLLDLWSLETLLPQKLKTFFSLIVMYP